jgi:hypothetical protein
LGEELPSPPSIGQLHEYCASPGRHTPHLSHREPRCLLGEVLEHGVGEDDIEGAAGERERCRITTDSGDVNAELPGDAQ